MGAVRDILKKRLPRIESQIANETATTHAYLAALSLGLDVAGVPLERFIPVRVYLSELSRESIDEVSEAVDGMLDELGFAETDDFPAETGSWFKKWFAKSKEAMTQPNVVEILKKGERALELEYLHCKQAEADRHQAEGTAALIQSLQGQSAAVCQIGSILLVKSTDSAGHSQVMTRTLTQSEIVALEQQPSALKSPVDVLRFLDGVGGSHRPAPVLTDGDDAA
jgi:hypothetical protein